MQITSALLFTILSASSVSARCYLGEWSWDDQRNAAYHAGRACRGYDGVAGAFQGWFAPNEQRHVCVNGINNRRYDFTIHNQNDHEGFDLNDEDCFNRLQSEINCQFGGESTKAGWWVKSDPNIGHC